METWESRRGKEGKLTALKASLGFVGFLRRPWARVGGAIERDEKAWWGIWEGSKRAQRCPGVKMIEFPVTSQAVSLSPTYPQSPPPNQVSSPLLLIHLLYLALLKIWLYLALFRLLCERWLMSNLFPWFKHNDKLFSSFYKPGKEHLLRKMCCKTWAKFYVNLHSVVEPPYVFALKW